MLFARGHSAPKGDDEREAFGPVPLGLEGYSASRAAAKDSYEGGGGMSMDMVRTEDFSCRNAEFGCP